MHQMKDFYNCRGRASRRANEKNTWRFGLTVFFTKEKIRNGISQIKQISKGCQEIV